MVSWMPRTSFDQWNPSPFRRGGYCGRAIYIRNLVLSQLMVTPLVGFIPLLASRAPVNSQPSGLGVGVSLLAVALFAVSAWVFLLSTLKRERDLAGKELGLAHIAFLLLLLFVPLVNALVLLRLLMMPGALSARNPE
jgi:hypothetical protein